MALQPSDVACPFVHSTRNIGCCWRTENRARKMERFWHSPPWLYVRLYPRCDHEDVMPFVSPLQVRDAVGTLHVFASSATTSTGGLSRRCLLLGACRWQGTSSRRTFHEWIPLLHWRCDQCDQLASRLSSTRRWLSHRPRVVARFQGQPDIRPDKCCRLPAYASYRPATLNPTSVA